MGWSITDHHPNNFSGFSATVFANGTEKVLAIRGTEIGSPLDTYQDLLKTDLAEIGILGVAASQAVSLFNYVQRLTAPAGATGVVQLTLRTGDLPPAGDVIDLGELASDRYLWLEASHTGTGLGVLQPGDRVTVTGHSLGGHLAALSLRLLPSVFSEAFTFNAPGFDPPLTSGRLTDQLVGLFASFTPTAPATSFLAVADRIHTLQSESTAPGDDAELVSADLTGLPPSTETEIATEKNSHSIDQIVDALAVQSVLSRLNPALSLSQLTALYEAASRQPGATDERIVEALSAVVLGDPSPLPIGEAADIAGSAPFEARIALHDRILAIQQRIGELGGLTLQSLLDPRNADLVAKAATDVGYRHALATLQPFAITGNASVYAALNDAGQLDLFDPATGAGDLTTAYLTDRAHVLRQVLARNTADTIVPPASPWSKESYLDVPLGLRFSTDASHLGTEAPPDYARFVFGGALPDTLTGASADDRLYGGAGDDVLRGAGGSDYLEGGRGMDTYWWSPGDGVDRILDVDGNGRVLLDGSSVTGGQRVADGIYRNTAGTVTYVWKPAAGTDSGPLVVNGDVRIEHFLNGDLAIVLDDTPPAPRPCDYAHAGGDEADALVYEDLQARYGSVALTASIEAGGGAGNDLLITVEGADRITAGTGDDLVLSGAEADVVDAGDGNDQVFTGLGADAVDGGAGDDLVVGNQFLLYDTSGPASEDQRAWEDLRGLLRWVNDGPELTDDGFLQLAWHVALPTAPLEGVSRTDGTPYRYDPASGELRYLDAQGNVVRTLSHQLRYGDWTNADPKSYAGGTGNDLLAGADGDDALSGGAGDDSLAGNGGDDVLAGGDGNDCLIAGAGSDCLDGGAGDDSLIGEDGADALWGGDGNDRLFGDSDDRPLALHGSDHLFGGAGNDTLVGHGGDDVLEGEDGDDGLFGGPGRDRLLGGAGADRLQGGEDADLLDGGAGADTLHGETGDDTLIGDVGDDALFGGDGDDVLSGDAGRDLLDGGAGTDTYLFHRGDGFDRLEDADGQIRLTFGAGIELEDINLQRPWDGSLLIGYGDGDAVQLAPGLAARMTEVRFASGLPVAFEDLIATRLATPQSESGSAAADGLQGGLADDRLWGNDGDDRLAGSDGDDELSGGAGADALYGDGGADVLDGGAGDDLLAGGPGDDTLYGNYGSDRYLFALGDGHDTIADYGDLGTVDTLAFGDGIAAGDLRFSRQPGGDLLVEVGSGGDAVTMRGWFNDPRQRVEQLAFTDGTVMDTGFLDTLDVAPQTGTAGDDRLVGTEYDDRILGAAGNDRIDGMEGDDRLDGGPGDDTYVLGLHSGFDTIEDAAGIGTLALEHGLQFGDLARERDGVDLVVRLRGSEQTGVRIAGYYAQPAEWRVLTESGAARGIEEITETAYWGDASDPLAQAEADYLDALRADFLERMDWFGYTRGAGDTVEHLPVAATVANYRYSTLTTVTDYATGTISQRRYSSTAGPDLERVVYQSGDEAYTYWDTITGQRVHFVIESVPLDGNYVYAKRWFQQTTQATGGQLWLTPQKTTVEQLAPEAYESWQTVGTLPNGVSGVRLTNETTLTSVTRTEGTLGTTGTLSFPYTLYESDFIVERLTGTDQDDGLYTGRATHTILEGGGGNDTLRSIGNWSWGSAGLFFDGGPGNDRVTGGIHGDRLTGGSGSDYLNGAGGADHYLIDTSASGFDLIDDSGSLWVDLETGWSAYKSWFYGSQGLDPGTLQSQVFRGPALPTIPRADATDYAALEPFLASGYVPLDEVELSGGVRPQDLVLSWGYDSQPGYYGGLRAVLNVGWGDPDSGLRIVLPPPPVSTGSTQSFTPWVQPDWFLVERGVGLGVERFRFGSGEVLSMAELIALAPPAPLHPQEVLARLDGTAAADQLVAAVTGGWLLGGAGDDRIDGSASADVMEGGAGNDTLRGGAGSDLYLYDTGDGHDSIAESGASGEIDVIKLGGGPDVLTTDVLRSGNDLVLRFDDLGNGITIRNWYADPAARIEQVVFEEGWIWDSAELERRAVVENLAPVATNPTPVAVSEATAFRVAIPATTFVDPEGETALRVTAALADGSVLPSWLGFDAAALAFTGTPPIDASGVYQIALTATDSLGASVQAYFDLEVLDVNPPLTGQDASETLVGTVYADRIDGGRGDDRISGGGGDDVLIGGPGADVLDGGDGDDRLVYSADGVWLGDRQSANLGSPRNPSGGGSVPLAGRAASSDVLIGGPGIDTLVGTDGSDSVLLDGGLGVSRRPGEARISGVERFELGAGDDLLNLTSRRHAYGDVLADGGDGDDVLWTSAGNDRLLGGAGADHLDGGSGNDELLGGDGADWLEGAAGDDLLVGGTGDDRLAGGRGSDTYRYAPGDGADVISEQGSAKETDRLAFEGDVTADRLWFRQLGDDLVLGVTGTAGNVTIEGWYADAGRRIEEIVAGDGRVLHADDVDRLVAAMAVFDVQDAAEIAMPLGSVPVLAPVIAAVWQPAAA